MFKIKLGRVGLRSGCGGFRLERKGKGRKGKIGPLGLGWVVSYRMMGGGRDERRNEQATCVRVYI